MTDPMWCYENPAEAAALIDRLWLIEKAARAYRAAEPPHIWRGKNLRDLANALDDTLEAVVLI